MSNYDKQRENLGFQIDELVAIGDHLHNCQTALIIADVYDGKDHTTMGCATGSKNNLLTMIQVILEQNPQLEDIIIEAVARKKMKDMANMVRQIKPNNQQEE